MVERYVVYDTTTGQIGRSIRGTSIVLEDQKIESGESTAKIDPRADIRGKMIDVDTGDLVDDPDQSPPPTFADRVREVLRDEGLL